MRISRTPGWNARTTNSFPATKIQTQWKHYKTKFSYTSCYFTRQHSLTCSLTITTARHDRLTNIITSRMAADKRKFLEETLHIGGNSVPKRIFLENTNLLSLFFMSRHLVGDGGGLCAGRKLKSF